MAQNHLKNQPKYYPRYYPFSLVFGNESALEIFRPGRHRGQ